MRSLPPAEPEPLVLPRGVRLPQAHELTEGSEAERARVRQAQLTTGYRVIAVPSGPNAGYIEANAHAVTVFALFHELALILMPRVAAPIVTTRGGDAHTGPSTIRAAALRVFEPHVQALQHDGFLGFGLIADRAGVTEQLFVPPAKYLQIWTTQPDLARSVLARHRIPEVQALQRLDQYPVVSESLPTASGEDGWPLVLQHIRAAFATLPAPER